MNQARPFAFAMPYMPPPQEVTLLLHRMRDGDAAALDALMPLLYDELRMIARKQLRSERPNHTINPTALVNEAYLKLVQQREVSFEDRTQFFAAAAGTMRRILVDYARMKKRLKRGGGASPVPLDEDAAFLTEVEAEEVLALDEALERLQAINPRGSQVVHYRYFGGLSLEETAALMDVSVKTIQRAWVAARAWLRKEVAGAL